MATDFAVSLRRFLTDHLAGLRGYSPNTIASYRDAFKLLICYFRDQRSTPPEKLTLERIDAAAITGFLDWLRTSRGNSASTCNQRLAAIDSFFTWMQTQDPARMACYQDILAIPASRHDQPTVTHLSVEQTRRLLAAPNRSTRAGRRNATLLATLYDTAARVQELADLSVRDLRLDGPAMAALTGKGRKTRHVPLDANTTALLADYLAEQHLGGPGRPDAVRRGSRPAVPSCWHRVGRGGSCGPCRSGRPWRDRPGGGHARSDRRVLEPWPRCHTGWRAGSRLSGPRGWTGWVRRACLLY